MNTKFCTKCKLEKLFNKFSSNKGCLDGKGSWCKKYCNIIAKNYYEEYKEELKIYKKKWYQEHKKELGIKHKYYHQKYNKKYPWKVTFNSIQTRCNNPNCDRYKWYGGKGIKCLITVDEIKILWFRDKAFEMKKPSIDRKNNDENYTFKNCQFIELVQNIKKRFINNELK